MHSNPSFVLSYPVSKARLRGHLLATFEKKIKAQWQYHAKREPTWQWVPSKHMMSMAMSIHGKHLMDIPWYLCTVHKCPQSFIGSFWGMLKIWSQGLVSDRQAPADWFMALSSVPRQGTWDCDNLIALMALLADFGGYKNQIARNQFCPGFAKMLTSYWTDFYTRNLNLESPVSEGILSPFWSFLRI